MKKIGFILFIFCYLPILAQKKDQLILTAKDYYDRQEYTKAINILKREDIKRTEPGLFNLIRSQYRLVSHNYYENIYEFNYEELEQLREYIADYFTMFQKKSNKARGLLEIQEIDREVRESYPMTKEAFMEEITRKLQSKILHEAETLLAQGQYEQLFSLMDKVDEEKILPYYHIAFYRALGHSRNLNDLTISFEKLTQVRNELQTYTNTFRNEDISYTKRISAAIAYLENYPKTLAEYEKEKKEKQIKEEVEIIEAAYNKANYDDVLTRIIQFQKQYPNNNYQSRILYVKGASYYYLFKGNSFSWTYLQEARKALNEYLDSYTSFAKDNYYIAKSLLQDLNTDYPKDPSDQKRKEEESRKAQIAYNKEQQKRERRVERFIRRIHRRDYWGSFFAIGYEYGRIAPYGFRIEFGSSKRRIGGFLLGRGSFDDTSKLENYILDEFPKNKMEAIVGLNFRFTHWAYLNVGQGIGQHYYPELNDYNQKINLERKIYMAGYAGATFRLGTRINLIGGMSFIAVTEGLYTPEYTFGLTINLIGN